MDTCHRHAGMTKVGWIASNRKGTLYNREHDG